MATGVGQKREVVDFPIFASRTGSGNGTGQRKQNWARDRTRFDNYVVEAALAHLSGDKVERAYARSDVLEKRRQLMNAWADFCETPPVKSTGKVVAMRSA